MELLSTLVKLNLPGSIGFLWITVLIGVVMLFGNHRLKKWGQIWLTIITAFYLLLAMPVTVRMLERGLDQGYGWISTPEEVDGIGAVVVLGGGSITYQARGESLSNLGEQSSLRVLEGARLHKLLDNPKVIVSGGVSSQAGRITPESIALRDGLVTLGVPHEAIVLESESGNTLEHPVNLEQVLEEQGVERFVLVTSPAHMYRALELFKAAGMDPIPSVGVWHSEELNPPVEGWIPNARSLYASQVALREYLALSYYRIQGWLPSP